MKSKQVRLTPPAALRAKAVTVVDLAASLGLSRMQVYGLLDPDRYPTPPALFDVRSDLAARVADFSGLPLDRVREFYARRTQQAS